ncbi:50S ribosomal protein L21 [Candidatus Zixiibacteriota bacterium]|nr:50S ribosomal protein L21 [candidate division Zixibacteria bacterium]
MYAVFESGGLQFNAEVGTILKIPFLAIKPGETIALEKVLLVKSGENSIVGNPYLASARVEAEVLGEGLAEKVDVYKFKRRTKNRRHNGHRQKYTEIKINKIITPEN